MPASKGMPTIAHHHDFYWERDRFLKGCAGEYLDKAFPPPITEMFEHVVINSGAKRSLKERLGVESTVIPNVFDFEKTHKVHRTSYVKKDKGNFYCGMINVYNFLADSFKYNRVKDSGYLVGRLFINQDLHFFVEDYLDQQFYY